VTVSELMDTTSEQAHPGLQPHGQPEGQEPHHEEHGHHCPTVTIHVNSRDVILHPGHYAIPTLKMVSNVPLTDDLDELVECEFVPLPDDGHVTIRGCEIFVSHVKDGGSA